MKTYMSGQKVEYGIYVSLKAIDARFVGADDETLEGKEGAEYVHLPSILLVVATPVMGGVFVLTFPLIILGSVFGALGVMLARGIKALATSQVHLTQMRWEPATAYLNKSKREKAEKGKTEEQSELKDLKDEVDQKRNQ